MKVAERLNVFLARKRALDSPERRTVAADHPGARDAIHAYDARRESCA